MEVQHKLLTRLVSVILLLVLLLFSLTSCGPSSEETKEMVIGTWVSFDYDVEGTCPAIKIILKDNGTCFRGYYYNFYDDDAHYSASNMPWVCDRNKVICNIDSWQEFTLEYDEKTDTLVQTEGYKITVFERLENSED